ncbi:hypothetical protein K439DRAFT_1270449, partial [Ramaria rubella]
ILMYPPRVPGATVLSHANYARLAPDSLLNDNLVSFALLHWLHQQPPHKQQAIHSFSTYFYTILSKKDGYSSVRKWTRRFDIFAKKYVIVPIHQ